MRHDAFPLQHIVEPAKRLVYNGSSHPCACKTIL